MSYSRIILVATLSFWSSASLIGMESWFSWRKKATPENNYYLNEDIQKLMLFKKAKVEDKYGTLVPEDVHNIIVKQGYNHYCSQLFETKTYCPFSIQNLKFEKYWQTRIDTTNNENRTKQFQGKKINVNDFDFITMNEEGRKIFYRVLLTVPRPREDGTMQYVYPTNVITKSFLDMTER